MKAGSLSPGRSFKGDFAMIDETKIDKAKK